MTQPTFDIQAVIQALREGKGLNGKDDILIPLIKQLTEAAMQVELEQNLESEDKLNCKNGSTRKTVKSLSGNFELNTPRDRNGTVEPLTVKKHQTHLTDDLERKVLALWAIAFKTFVVIFAELYDIELSKCRRGCPSSAS